MYKHIISLGLPFVLSWKLPVNNDDVFNDVNFPSFPAMTGFRCIFSRQNANTQKKVERKSKADQKNKKSF